MAATSETIDSEPEAAVLGAEFGVEIGDDDLQLIGHGDGVVRFQLESAPAEFLAELAGPYLERVEIREPDPDEVPTERPAPPRLHRPHR